MKNINSKTYFELRNDSKLNTTFSQANKATIQDFKQLIIDRTRNKNSSTNLIDIYKSLPKINRGT